MAAGVGSGYEIPNERDEPAAELALERCTDLFDEEHLEQVFATVQRAAESTWVTMLEGPYMHVSRSDFERPFLWHRACGEAEDVPVELITRFVSTPPQKKLSSFVKSEEPRAELRPADPNDKEGMGRVVIIDQVAVFFGSHVVEQRLYATRRLLDGTGIGIKVPVDFLDGRWTTRKCEDKFIPTVAFRSESTARGSRLTILYKERPTVGFVPFLPTSIISQILVRICAKIILQFRRAYVAKWQAAAAAARRPARRLLFASGSAAPPLHLSSPTFSVHACSPRIPVPSPCGSPELVTGAAYPPSEPAPPPSPDTNHLFLDLIGVEEPPADSEEPPDPSGRIFRLSNSQLVKTEGYAEKPGFRSVASEAMLASLDLSIHMEALSLGVPPPAAPPGEPPAPAAGSGTSSEQPGKDRARPRPEEEPSEEPSEEPPQPPAKPKRAKSRRKPRIRPPLQPYKPPRPILCGSTAPEPPAPAVVEPTRMRRARERPQPKHIEPKPPAYPLQPTAAGLPGYYATYSLPLVLRPAPMLPAAAFPTTEFGSVLSDPDPGTL